MEIQTVEHNILIAERVKGKGDTWILVGGNIEYPSLTETLEAYFQKTGENIHFRLEPLNSKLFAIKEHEEKVVIEPPKHFNIYGDFD